MNKEEFLKQIYANPLGDAERLVYADWLQEQGLPRGEFIALQFAVQKESGEDKQKNRELRDLVESCLEKHREEFIDEELSFLQEENLRKYISQRENIIFNRGFIAGLRLSELYKKDLKIIMQSKLANNFTHLELGHLKTKAEDYGLSFVSKLQNIRVLKLIGAEPNFKSFTHLTKLVNLRELSLHGSKIAMGCLKQLSAFPKLEWLDLNMSNIGDPSLAFLADMKYLKHLNLPFRISEHGLVHLEKIKSLETLDVRRTRISKEALREFQASHPNINLIFMEYEGSLKT